jgi:hypothetical protein
MSQTRSARLAFGLLMLSIVAMPSGTTASSDDAPVDRSAEAPLFRVFLKDGGSLVSYGEFARVENQVVFSMPTSTATDNPALQLVNISADVVDWPQTDHYSDSTRARRYLSTQAEGDYALLTGELAQALNDVALTGNAAERLKIVEKARKTLAEWPSSHFNYRHDEIQQMVGMLNEALADLRAAAGSATFDLTFVTGVSSAKPLAPALPPPTPKEAIEQILIAARLAGSPVERISLLTVAAGAIDRDASMLPGEWSGRVRESVVAEIAREVRIDREYRALGARMLKLADQRAADADVRGVSTVLSQIRVRDAALGSSRPETVNALMAEVEARLDSARRLRLARDHWAFRQPVVRRYLSAVDVAFRGFAVLKPSLEDIKSLAGSPPAALSAVRRVAEEILSVAANVVPPEECRTAHELIVSAAQLADNAALIRRDAVRSADLNRAWNASSAAAGALMLADRAESEVQALLRVPQLPQ